MSKKRPKVLIVGTGLAGMSAAINMCDRGYDVHMFEASHKIGGRTSSWNERGMLVESGLHRFLGFYRALPKLLEKVGIDVDTMLCWEDEIEIRTPNDVQAVLGLAPLHKPLKTAWTVLGHNNFLPAKEKLLLTTMFTAGIKDYKLHPEDLDNITVLEYAKRYDISDETIVRILKPFTEGIFFMPIDKYSAYNFFGLFAPFLTNVLNARVGAFMGGMSDVMMEPLARYIYDKGGTITLGAKVDTIVHSDGSVRGVSVGEEYYSADKVILATSLYGAKKVIENSFDERDEEFQKLLSLPTMPAVTFQIELSDPAMDIDRTTFGPQTSLASFAEQSRTTFRSSNGRLSTILTPPEKYIDMPAEEILQVVTEDALALGIDIRDKVIAYHKVSLPHDFYSLGVGNEKRRPLQKTSIKGLALAGDYTKQEHLATMEGAVVSGERAVEALFEN